MIRRIIAASCLACTLIVPPAVVAAAQSASDAQATVTFSGRSNGPVTVIDHNNPASSTTIAEPVPVNLAPQHARERYRAQQEAGDKSSAGVDAAADAAKDPNAVPEPPPGADPTESGTDAPATAVEPELTPEQGLQMLRERNWVTYSSDDRHFPEVVFNPQTKQFMPTAEAIKGLKEPVHPLNRPAELPQALDRRSLQSHGTSQSVSTTTTP